MKQCITLLLCCFAFSITAQKKVMEHKDKALWNSIVAPQISNNGDYVLFETNKGDKDKTVHLKGIEGTSIMSHPRSKGAKFTYDSKYVVFAVNAWKDSIKEMKRKKVKAKDLPKDTLVVYNIESKKVVKIPNVKSYNIPQKWSGIVSYSLEPTNFKKAAKGDKKSKVKTVSLVV